MGLVFRATSSGIASVGEIAHGFPWPHGPKRVIVPEKHLGLVEHVHRAGALASEYSAIILLEDDLVASPAYYHYAASALDFYRDDDRIAGVSLYSLPRSAMYSCSARRCGCSAMCQSKLVSTFHSLSDKSRSLMSPFAGNRPGLEKQKRSIRAASQS